MELIYLPLNQLSHLIQADSEWETVWYSGI